MSWNGSIATTITDANVNGGTAIGMRANNVTLAWSRYTQNEAIVGKSTSPNNVVDYTGLANRVWTIVGIIDLTS